MDTKIRNFTDLEAWKRAHALVLAIYSAVRSFPQFENYILTAQILRCAISVSSNIAEGFSRQTKREKHQFYSTAKGSLTELQNQLLIARDVGYIKQDRFHEIAEMTVHVSKLITGLMRSAESKQ